MPLSKLGGVGATAIPRVSCSLLVVKVLGVLLALLMPRFFGVEILDGLVFLDFGLEVIQTTTQAQLLVYEANRGVFVDYLR